MKLIPNLGNKIIMSSLQKSSVELSLGMKLTKIR